MKTKKNVEVLLENGIHFNTIMNLSDRQIGVLAERFFKSKPMGDIEQAKKDSLKSMKAFIKRYLGIENPDGLSYKEALEKMKMVARHAKSPNSNRITDLGAEVYRIAKDLDIPEDKKEETKEGVQTTRKTLEIQKFDSGTVNQMKQNNQGMNVTDGEVTPNKDGGLTVTREIGEKFESKAQQGFFWAKCNTSKGVKKKKWCELAKEFSDETTKSDYKKMPKKKNSKKTDENYEKFLEERIMEMIEKHIEPTMTKRDFIRSIQEKKNNSENFMLENPKKNSMFAQNKDMEMKTMKRPIGKISSFEMKENTKEKEAPTTPGIKTPTRRKNPHRDPAPGIKENPKANGGQKEAPSKPGIKTPTRRKNPHKDPAPGIKENPKAEEQKNDFMSTITSILNNA